MRIYGDPNSGNCLKVKWTADYLGIPYTWVDTDVVRGDCKQPSFLAKFPFAQVPAVAFDDDRTLAQSNAIIRYLARDSALLPADAFMQAKIDEWLFWEQYSHEPYIAVCRFQVRFKGLPKSEREPWRVQRGEAALDLMEQQLHGRTYFVGDELSIADISLLAYTRMAHDGGFDLASRPRVRAWIDRCETRLKLSHTDFGS